MGRGAWVGERWRGWDEVGRWTMGWITLQVRQTPGFFESLEVGLQPTWFNDAIHGIPGRCPGLG